MPTHRIGLVVLYSCLVALLAGGRGEHQRVESAVPDVPQPA